MSSSPHDALFKAVFGEPEHARGALRAALPVGLADALDWPALALLPGNFVDAALVERHTDLLFSAPWRDGGEALVYLLFEHQSTPDDEMAYRLLRYMGRIWERWRSEHPGAKRLPAILPIVLYHGATAWSAPRSLEAVLDVPAAVRPMLEPYLVRFSYLVDDLSETPEAELRGRAMTALGRLVEVCFKYARTRTDLVEMLSGWAEVLREVARASHGLEALVRVMRYILLVNDRVESAALQALVEREVSPEAKEAIVTAGERLIQQGERRMLLRMMRERFGSDVGAATEQRIATASDEQLNMWSRRIFSAASLDEFLAD